MMQFLDSQCISIFAHKITYPTNYKLQSKPINNVIYITYVHVEDKILYLHWSWSLVNNGDV